MRVAVVGHVEWIRFARVDEVPDAGQIAHSFEDWEQAGGGGGVAAVQLALLADEAHLFTVLGNDELGRRARNELSDRGVIVHAATDERPQRWAFTHVDDHGERTITTVGPKLRPRGHDESLPWHELAGLDAVFFVAGDVDALVHARRARVLTATSRELEVLVRAGVQLDALIGSGEDDAERYRPGEIDPPPKLVVTTSGGLGGWARPGGPYTAAEPPGEVIDAYGAGDSFAAGLTFALASGLAGADALGFAARCGAGALTGRGVAPRHVALAG
ncbi:MAG TPA: PfkB family carbohydrate kinase [Acidimicrobiia bacterium]|nr:PfkB family carbohydrate kinase [Acidimicrobiia bacterium]